ncbi:hypothetical protein HA402_003112 [Bradysia odoriphaga]|nr:hypothetical protein HA402_003112 [Bradysia odoriphaga]
MSVVYSQKDCVLISHKEYIDHIYQTTIVNQGDSGSDLKTIFTLREDVFNFVPNNRNDTDDTKRRKINAKKSSVLISQNPELHELNQTIASKSKEFLDHCKRNAFFNVSSHHTTDNSLSVFKEVCGEETVNVPLNGKNTLDNAILTNISGQTYLIPPKCKFTNSCVSAIDKFADEFYDFIVIDPPWWNKYIRRLRTWKREEGYDMMYNDDILKIPLEDLIHPNTIVAIWCTNSPTHSDFVKTIALAEMEFETTGHTLLG